ncbi:MAG: hypothetical protein GY928_25735 [Colwellia sp.]|nr:hypothetical protein [Colwellia sp.]
MATYSKRQQIMTELLSIFSKLTKLYGHQTNLGSNIFEWKTIDFQSTELPGIDVRDTSEIVETRGGRHYYTLTIELEAKVSASTSTAVAREVLADIQTLLACNQNLGGLVHLVKPVQNELLNFERVNNKFGTVSMTLEVEYATKAFQPYT